MATTGPLQTVHQYINAFNRGDAQAMAATFAVPDSILDGMPPHSWLGPTPLQDWYRDVFRRSRAPWCVRLFRQAPRAIAMRGVRVESSIRLPS
jgi:hypothetical protein